MAKIQFASVDEYVAAQPESSRPILEKVRSLIRKAVPDAEEVISYQIPAYKLEGGRRIFFAGWKKHFSLYPATGRLQDEFAKDLAPYEVSKGTIRFPLSEGVPSKLIERLARFMANEASAVAKTKAAARPKLKTRARRKVAAKKNR
jgi:uncharacterized protein YdhG (YjbR/CyaY superfamily)